MNMHSQLTRLGSSVLVWFRTSLAEENDLVTGGSGSSAHSTSGTSSSANRGCQRVILSSGTVSGLCRLARNFYNKVKK